MSKHKGTPIDIVAVTRGLLAELSNASTPQQRILWMHEVDEEVGELVDLVVAEAYITIELIEQDHDAKDAERHRAHGMHLLSECNKAMELCTAHRKRLEATHGTDSGPTEHRGHPHHVAQPSHSGSLGEAIDRGEHGQKSESLQEGLEAGER